jgi:hypothetical protein
MPAAIDDCRNASQGSDTWIVIAWVRCHGPRLDELLQQFAGKRHSYHEVVDDGVLDLCIQCLTQSEGYETLASLERWLKALDGAQLLKAWVFPSRHSLQP